MYCGFESALCRLFLSTGLEKMNDRAASCRTLISDGEGSLGDIHLASLLSVVMLFRVTLDCLRFFRRRGLLTNVVGDLAQPVGSRHAMLIAIIGEPTAHPANWQM